ncbi:MAG: 50S ribosomal protein L3 [Candidatus Marinimicrobia bacterium]|nr:50S ribosomal protein L3 [Candidatus Neomarinimicrobiota bacterium]MBL7059651.1 50S ribosomal protein L3 [Candidatus Neomarinimicrobiota bacterium]
MRGMIGKKIGMTQIYLDSGKIAPVTIVEAGPCVVTQVKTEAHDGYDAVQVGYESRKKKHVTKPMEGHYKKAGVDLQKTLAEFEIVPGFEYKTGQKFTVSLFNEGDKVNVLGKSKGKGFAGVIKRHNFHRPPITHGQKHTLRHPGSIGQASSPSRVFKGMKMAGHYGNSRVTVQNLEVVKIVPEKNQIFIKGAVPGANNGIIYISK